MSSSASLPIPPLLLDPEQERCATAPVTTPLVIYSPAGSGKTRTLVARILSILQLGIDPHSILALTFSRKACEELRQRIADTQIHPDLQRSIQIFTFHAYALRLLRHFGAAAFGLDVSFNVIERNHTLKMIRETIEVYLDLRSKGTAPAVQYADPRLSLSSADRIMKHIMYRKEKGLGPATGTENGYFHEEYEKKLSATNSMDFSDLVTKALQLFRVGSKEVVSSIIQLHRFILVDEFQDVSGQQLDFLQALGGASHVHVTVVGDANQAIYGFRGGLNDAFQKFTGMFPQTSSHRLCRNYRSTQPIIDFASGSVNAPSDDVKCVTSEGAKPMVHLFNGAVEEAEGVVQLILKMIRQDKIPPHEIAVLSRVGTQVLPLVASALKQFNIPTTRRNPAQGAARQPTTSGMASSILSYCRLALYDDDDAFLHIYNVPRRGVGESAIKYLRSMAQEYGLASLFSTLVVCAQKGYPTPQRTQNGATVRKLPKQQCTGLDDIVTIIQDLRRWVEALPLPQFIKKVCELLHQGAATPLTEDEDNVGNPMIETLLASSLEFSEREMSKGYNSRSEMLNDFIDDARTLQDDEDYDLDPEGSVVVSTIHQSKGLEWPVVFVIRCNEGYLPACNAMYAKEEEYKEEGRMFYVGCTRAARQLHLTAVTDVPISRFLLSVPTGKYGVSDWTTEAEVRQEHVRHGEHPLMLIAKS